MNSFEKEQIFFVKYFENQTFILATFYNDVLTLSVFFSLQDLALDAANLLCKIFGSNECLIKFWLSPYPNPISL